MKKTSIAFLIINFLFLIGNVRFWFRIAQENSQYDKGLSNREADVILNEFITNAANNRRDFSFEIGKNHVSYDPNYMTGPYTITKNDQYTSTWSYTVRFEAGYTYRAEVWRTNGGRWSLQVFELTEPNDIVQVKASLKTLVGMAHKHMFHFQLSHVDFHTLVDANAFKGRPELFLDRNSRWVDLSSFEISESDTKVKAVMYSGQVVSYEFDSLLDRVRNGEKFHW